ncbi:probable cyclin-dependent serine/threonine-protein kinase DDB_G0292550 [Spodoptera frugiperda]|uniref:Probable cyclin-dependent serine/threonine-protein kinase DDB_G0292550 n=1 Tax=Spodoptera frugiperda TaxID=7108 RepID=A0A9R0ECI7_SPOFR|nr:probable cyclin-dependent serine/threonine-protein kinase DDB_G0292550 [Spodoptera frugiperda]
MVYCVSDVKNKEQGVENLLINNVTTEVPDTGSDDDVIEVVRDDAPIEILSDGEELELEKTKQALNNTMQNMDFLSQPANPNVSGSNTDESNTEIDVNRIDEDQVPHPITHIEITSNSIPHCEPVIQLEMPIFETTIDIISGEKLSDNSFDDNDEENVYVNVTDDVNVDEPIQTELNQEEVNVDKTNDTTATDPIASNENNCNSVDSNKTDVPNNEPNETLNDNDNLQSN